jgi:pimeloyl-ACP methyl ester carboxylesterase
MDELTPAGDGASPDSPKIEQIDLAGARIEYIRIKAQDPGNPTLVFLHEGLGSIALWRDFPASVAARTGLGAVVYSRHGNGFSSPLESRRNARYMHDEALVALPELLDALHIGEAVLVGHSDGASIALVYAATYPSRVRAIVLEAPHVFVEDCSIESIASIKAAYATTGLRERMSRYHTDPDATFHGWNDIWLADEFRDWNIESYVAAGRAPIFALQGVDDEYGTLAQLESIAQRATAPVDRLLLAACGHAPHRDRRPYVETAISDWILEALKA